MGSVSEPPEQVVSGPPVPPPDPPPEPPPEPPPDPPPGKKGLLLWLAVALPAPKLLPNPPWKLLPFFGGGAFARGVPL